MSRTTMVVVEDRSCWAFDDAFAVWLAMLIESVADPTESFAERLEDWKVATGVPDFGMTVRRLDAESTTQLASAAGRAREVAAATGDVPVERLREWSLVDGLTVSDGFSRYGDAVALARILEVADGFLALMDGSFPDDPIDGAWFLGTGDGWAVIRHKTLPRKRFGAFSRRRRGNHGATER
ncbi:MAG: hypothetical protein ACT4QF_07425 [Sporichthyaceae bacterium]